MWETRSEFGSMENRACWGIDSRHSFKILDCQRFQNLFNTRLQHLSNTPHKEVKWGPLPALLLCDMLQPLRCPQCLLTMPQTFWRSATITTAREEQMSPIPALATTLVCYPWWKRHRKGQRQSQRLQWQITQSKV